MRFTIPRLIALLSAVSALLLASVPAASAQSAADWQPGPGAALDNTYAGFIDVPSGGSTVPGGGSFTVAGWFADKTAQGWAGADGLELWLGTMDGGGKMLAKAMFAQFRGDVGTALGNPFLSYSGFTAAVAGSSVPAGPQTLNIYAHTPGKGWWFKSFAVNGGGPGTGTAAPAAAPAPAASAPTSGAAPVVVITSPTENSNVSTKSDYVINGTTSDAPNIDRIEVWINGERNSGSGVLLGTTTPSSDGSWSMTFTPTHFASTHSNIYVYSHDKATKLETEVVRGFNIVDK